MLVVDLDEAEAAKLLALHDPLAAMAEANDEMLAELVANVETENAAVQALLNQMLRNPELPGGYTAEDDLDNDIPREVGVPEAFQVLVECRDETEQQKVYERLNGEGYKCKLLTL